MADPSTPYHPLDPGRIDTQNPVELQYWCRELHCTEAELADAVSKVGNHVTAVREYLASRP
jgi:Protein of unknown function (DUF3606)